MTTKRQQKQKEKREAADAELAKLAYDRADAWAHSVAGTPYGSTTPTLAKDGA